MSPNKNMDSVSQSNEKTPAKPEKRFSLKQKIGGFLIGMGIVAGAHNLANTEKPPLSVVTPPELSLQSPELYLQAPTAVDPSKALAIEQEPVVNDLKEPYVEAIHPVEIVKVDTSTTSEHPAK